MLAVLGFTAGKAGFCSQVVEGQKGRELCAQRKARDRGQAGAGAANVQRRRWAPGLCLPYNSQPCWRTDMDTPVKCRAPCRKAQTMGAWPIAGDEEMLSGRWRPPWRILKLSRRTWKGEEKSERGGQW